MRNGQNRSRGAKLTQEFDGGRCCPVDNGDICLTSRGAEGVASDSCPAGIAHSARAEGTYMRSPSQTLKNHLNRSLVKACYSCVSQSSKLRDQFTRPSKNKFCVKGGRVFIPVSKQSKQIDRRAAPLGAMCKEPDEWPGHTSAADRCWAGDLVPIVLVILEVVHRGTAI